MIYTSISQLAGNTKPVYFKFWANCILVKGYKRGIVADLFRRRQVVVSRLFCTLFDKYMSVPVADLNGDTGFDEIKGYLKMLDYFVKNDFGVYTDNPAELAPLSMEYDSPYLSTTMVLKADSDTDRESVLERVKAITRHSVLSLQINDEGHPHLHPFLKTIQTGGLFLYNTKPAIPADSFYAGSCLQTRQAHN